MADPGFPRGGGANSPGGAPTYDFALFSQKLHKIERIWAPRGRIPCSPLDPPLIKNTLLNPAWTLAWALTWTLAQTLVQTLPKPMLKSCPSPCQNPAQTPARTLSKLLPKSWPEPFVGTLPECYPKTCPNCLNVNFNAGMWLVISPSPHSKFLISTNYCLVKSVYLS